MAMVDNKKNRYVILIWGLVIVSLMIPCVAAAAPVVHPYMLFHDISEVPGYQYRTLDPWKGWETGIISSANGYLSTNFPGNLGSYDRVSYRGSFAEYLGLAYQITKKPVYAQKAREALLNLNVGTVSETIDRANALGSYSLAYDWIQPTLDPATDIQIRDKLATLADRAYKDLNDNGKNLQYVTFADYHGQAYPMLGVAGAALSDYTNPNHLPLTSTPADWRHVGTDYLFENDKLHSYGRSLFSFGFEESSGKNLLGAYKSYVTDRYALWFQVDYHAYGENLFEKYPAAKKAFTSELWESLPNGYSNNYITNGNTRWTYQRGFISLLPDNEKGQVLNHIARADASTILPYSNINGGSPSGAILYCVYGNYASIPRTFPTTTSHLDPTSVYQVFRGSWNDDADWLSLITWNKADVSNRDMRHNDQLAFEYYSRGDLLLADAGEPKTILGGSSYGEYDINHNTIAIENPRTPFPLSPMSGSTSAGIFKGTDYSLTTPATVNTIIQMPWIQLLQSTVSIKTVMAGGYGAAQTLSSPVQYERTIVYPDADYFVVVDRFEGTQPWVYRNIFRPTSLMVTPTVDANKDGKYDASEVGHVNGALTIGSTPYNWLPLSPKIETPAGITTNSLTWTTKNPYGKDVRLNLYSAPSSDILIEKNIGRIGGYDARSEVFSPVVYFRTPAATSEYRVTALLSSYANEQAKNAQEIAVTGTGHAIKVSSSSSDDYIYTGKGTSSFAGFTTDADTVYIRQRGDNVQVTLLGGSYLKYQNDPWVTLSKKADSLTANREKGSTDYRIQGEPDLRGDIFQQPVDSNKIEKRTNSNEQQKNTEQQNPMVKSDTNAVSEESSDMILVKLGKIVLSIFASKTTNG
jgi:hypothetical protein